MFLFVCHAPFSISPLLDVAMSYTFSFTGNSSVLSSSFSEDLSVSGKDWELGLISFLAYHTVPNITKNNNRIDFKRSNGQEITIEIDEGAYTIEDLTAAIKKQTSPLGIAFSLKPNQNTQKCVISSDAEINFQKADSMHDLLGFKRSILSPNKAHTSDHIVKIARVNSIRILCNITTGTFDNGYNAHILHEFFPQVPPGYKIVEAPTNIIYLPINVERINNITLTLSDQDNRLIDFGRETVNIRLHLRKRRWD